VLASRIPWPLHGAFREWPERVAAPLREVAGRDLRVRSLLRGPLSRGAYEERYARQLIEDLGGESAWGPRFVFGASGLTLSGLAAGWEEGLEWSLGDPSPGGYDAELIAAAIAALRPDLVALGPAAAAVLENHGYLLADTAARRTAERATIEPLPPLPPHPHWLDPGRVRAALAGDGRRPGSLGRLRPTPRRRPERRPQRRSAELTALLERHRPLLAYDSLECCHAGSAAAICSLVGPGRANSLHRTDGTLLATAGTGAGDGQRLDLDFLGPTYGDGSSARGDDYLDESGASLAADALALREDGGLVYGRSRHDGDGTVWLQYWLCFYFSDRGHLGIEQFEGGWELVQLRLGSDGEPAAMTLARPGGGLRLSWDEVETTASEDGPVAVVYPARGSHAPLPCPGTFAAPVVPDHSDGAGPRLRPRLLEIGEAGPGWALWPGRWGATRRREFFEGESPHGPGARREWRHPDRFDLLAAPWTATPFAAGPPPAAPRLHARRESEGAATVEYSFPPAADEAEQAPPARIVAAPVDAAGTVGPPLALSADPGGGSFTLQLPRGREWHGVRAGDASALGVPGPVTTTALQEKEGERAG
jgi:hypothetical protein